MKYKYPRTYHLPWSESLTSDDKRGEPTFLENKEVVVTKKMDGENTSLYPNYIHARSIDFSYHPSRSWIQQFHASISYKIPEGIRICGENLYAKHSIFYDSLPSYFLAFSAWKYDLCLGWNESINIFKNLSMSHVSVIYEGIYDESVIKNIQLDKDTDEGYVVRLKDSFSYNDFNKCVLKFVRKNHVQTSTHWTKEEIIPNKLISS